MNRDLISSPSACAAGATVTACPPVEPTAYSYAIVAQQVADFFGMGSALLVQTDAALDPQPESLSAALSVSMPFPVPTPPVSPSDVPTSWQEIVSFEVDPSQAVGVPLVTDSMPFGPGTPFWLRGVFTDEKGCDTTVVLLFSDGITIGTDTPFSVSVNGGAFADRVALADESPSAPVAFEGEVGVCPAPQQALVVAPGCEFPVQVTNAAVSMGAGKQVTSAAAGATAVLSVPAGQRVLVLNHDGETPAAETGTYLDLGTGGGGAVLFPGDGPLVLAAPSGMVFPALEIELHVSAAAGSDRFANLSYYG